MADQTITVTIPAGDSVVLALGIIMTAKGRVVIGDNTAPLLTTNANDPKPLLMMLELARNEINHQPSADVPFRASAGLVRS